MKTVVTWLWKGNRNYTAHHVNVLASMFRRHLSSHRFVCITDEPGDYGDGVEVMPMPEAARALAKHKTLESSNFPSCYQRLWMFSDEAKALGDRVLLVDIDIVLTASVEHLFDYDDPFVGWQPLKSWGGVNRVGGGIYLMTPGAYPEVFDDFKGPLSALEARKAGYRGSDQAWISYKLSDKVAVWPDVGIYSIRDGTNLEKDACLIQFNGPAKPWDSGLSWAVEHWR